MPDCQLTLRDDSTWECSECKRTLPKRKDKPPRRNCTAPGPDVEPGLAEKIKHYGRAIAEWIEAGRPERSPEEVERIYTEHCEPCEWYDAQKSHCRKCGCRVCGEKDKKLLEGLLSYVHASGLVNKIRQKTQSCPIGKW